MLTQTKTSMNDKIRWQDILLAGIITFALRAATFYTPMLDVDEAFFGVFASVMKHGGIPYIDASDNKPPLIFLLYYAVWFIFGEGNMLAMHILTAIWITLTTVIIGRIGLHLADKKTGRFAMFLYAIITTLGEPKLLASNINIFMMLPTSACFLFFISAVKSDKWWKWFLCGAAGATAVFMRYQGAAILIIVALCVIIDSFSIRIFLRRMTLGLIGITVIAGLIFIYLIKIGALQAYFLSFHEGMIYSGQLASFAFWPRFLSKSSLFLLATLPFIVMTVFFTIKVVKKNASSKDALYLLIWFALSWVPVCYGRRFYSHYFIQLMPPLTLIAAWGLTVLSSKFFKRTWIGALAVWTLFFFLIHIEDLGLRQKTGIHPSDWVEISTLEYPVGDYIKSHTNKTDRIFVWGCASPIYSSSERLPASRFMWLDILINRTSGGSKFKVYKPEPDEKNPVASKLWKILFSELNKNRPVYIADTSHSEFGGYKNHLIENYPIFEWMQTNNYKLETTINGVRLYRSSIP